MDFGEALAAIREGGSSHESEDAARVICVMARDGLADSQVADLARALAESGESYCLDGFNPGLLCDVPSTGAPGSLSTLICPMVLAAAGAIVPKVSIPGSVAGGIDSLQILSGFRSRLTGDEFVSVLHECGVAHVEVSPRVCPADGALVRERRRAGLMACPELAAASLLSKKLVVPGVKSCFDIRLGMTGNIGNTVPEGRRAAELFCRIGSILGIKVSGCLTDNTTSPVSCLGRTESLRLMYRLLNGQPVAGQDARHLEVCMLLCSEALKLNGHSELDSLEKVSNAVKSGDAFALLEKFLACQGFKGDLANEMRNYDTWWEDSHFEIIAPTAGYWAPPDLMFMKYAFKRWPQTEDKQQCVGQRGVSYLVEAGSWVEKGTAVVGIAGLERSNFTPDPRWEGAYSEECLPDQLGFLCAVTQ